MFRVLCFSILLLLSSGLCGQDQKHTDYAVSFDGVDDYIDVGNIYDDLKLPFTVSAWISLDLRGLGTIFASQDNSFTYNGFHLYVVQSAIIIEYGDGLGNISADFRRGKSGSVENIAGRWVHVAAVVRGPSDIDLYLNGIDIGGKYIGNSQSPMNSSFPLESARIGYRSSVGINYHFQGAIDEIRIWNRSMTVDEIRDQMCRKLVGNEPGLVGYWDFNEGRGDVTTDKSLNHFGGVLKGNPKWVSSGAPVGDTSIYIYPGDWQDVALEFQDSLSEVRVDHVNGGPDGVHVYEVRKFPMESAGLNTSTVDAPYFGVFVAGLDLGNSFDFHYTYNDTAICKLFTRPDNSVSAWKPDLPALSQEQDRVEAIHEGWDSDLTVDLGDDVSLCNFQEQILVPLSDTTNFAFSWQDGSALSSYTASDFGTYWVTVSNGCVAASDTIAISSAALDDPFVPNVFSPNGDLFNQFFEIDSRIVGCQLVVYNRWGEEVYQSSSYQNDWDGSTLPSGVYFYTINSQTCVGEKKGTLTILR